MQSCYYMNYTLVVFALEKIHICISIIAVFSSTFKRNIYIYYIYIYNIYLYIYIYNNQLFLTNTITFGNKFKSDELYSSFKICDILIYSLKAFEIKEKHLKTNPGSSLRDIKIVAFNGLLQT